MAYNRTAQASDITLWTATPVASDAVTLATVNTGDFIWVVVTADSGVAPTITVADPTNGAYTAKLQVDHAGDQLAQQFYFKNSASATNLVITATISVSSRPFVAMYAAAWSGTDTVAGFDVEAGQVQTNPGGGTDAIDTTSATTNAIDLILGSLLAYGLTNLPPTIAAGTGFTQDLNLSPGVSNIVRWELEDKIQSGSGSDHATATITGSNASTVTLSLMMAVKPLVAAAGGPPLMGRQVYIMP